MTLDLTTLAVFALAVSLLGLSKGGLAGLGVLSMPMLIFVMPPAAAAGLILPVLMIQDIFSVWLYRGRWDVANLKLLLPAAAVGIAVGFALFAILPVTAMLGVLGAISLGFALRGLILRTAPARPPGKAMGWALGMVSGLTSTVLHQGGPPFQIYLIPQRLPRDTFVATTVTFFWIVNMMKLPGFIWLGQLTREGLIVAAVSAPFALLMTWVGARVVALIDPARFYVVVHLLLGLVGVKLLADALV